MNAYYLYSPPLASRIQQDSFLKLVSQLLLVSLMIFMVGFPLIFLLVGAFSLLKVYDTPGNPLIDGNIKTGSGKP